MTPPLSAHSRPAPPARLASNPDGIAGASAQTLLLQSNKVDRPGVDPAQLARPELILTTAAVPVYWESSFQERAQGADGGEGGHGGGYADFDQLEPEPFTVRSLGAATSGSTRDGRGTRSSWRRLNQQQGIQLQGRAAQSLLLSLLHWCVV